MSEHVLVLPRRELFGGEEPAFAGFRDDAGVYLERIERAANFRERGPVEVDPTLKQIIPYAVVSCDDVHLGRLVFLMRRRRGGSEARLHDLFSLGVGGHINPVDGDPASRDGRRLAGDALVEAALRREIAEELVIEARAEVRCIGVVNDDSTPVGAVHFGIVYDVRLDLAAARVRETEQLEGRFVTFGELEDFLPRLESWSRFVHGAVVPQERFSDGTPRP